MPIEILMPALSPTMEEGNLAKWHKKEGDKVEPGEVIAEIETDKATMEVEAVDEGTIGKILVSEGSQGVKVNAVIALLLEEGEDKKALGSYQPSAVSNQPKKEEKKEERKEEVKEERKAEKKPTANGQQPIASSRVKASPLAKRLAKEHGIDIEQVVGSGPHGRIIRDDVESFKKSGVTAKTAAPVGRSSQESTAIPVSGMRKVIAKRLLESKTTIPHFYLTIDCNVDEALKARVELNELAQKGKDEKPEYKLTINDFVVKAVAMALRKVPEANASWAGDAIMQYNNVDVSVAVAIDGGLITPIVKNADQKTLSEISNEVKDLAGRAKAGKLSADEYQGGGFSISNLGMFGIKEFSAIINPPQSCILAVGASTQQFVPDEAGNPKLVNIMAVTLSCDHRVVDGAVGATFLKWFRQYIEKPMTMFV